MNVFMIAVMAAIGGYHWHKGKMWYERRLWWKQSLTFAVIFFVALCALHLLGWIKVDIHNTNFFWGQAVPTLAILWLINSLFGIIDTFWTNLMEGEDEENYHEDYDRVNVFAFFTCLAVLVLYTIYWTLF